MIARKLYSSKNVTQSTLISAQQIIDETAAYIAKHNINPRREKYRHLVLKHAEKYSLDDVQVKQLARHLDIVVFSPPRFARAWRPSICKIYMSMKYTNRSNPSEFVVMIASKSLFGVKTVIHRTPNGYVSTAWFTTFVPELDIVAANYENAVKNIPQNLTTKQREILIQREFAQHVNDKINPKFPNGMAVEQLRATNAFFLKYLPDVEGICPTCFSLSLPRSGAGSRWFSVINQECEVRLSEPKPSGYTKQQVLYLTHNYEGSSKALHVKWNGITADSPVFDLQLKQPDTHLPWETYDYETLVNRLPTVNGYKYTVCQCKKVP